MSKTKLKDEPAPQIMLGPVAIENAPKVNDRMALLIWGPANCGKTTFAATAPGKKLWISFGDNEHVSVAHRSDVVVANVSDLPIDELFKHAQSDNPFNLDGVLAADTDISTVVVDSITAIEYRALQKAVKTGIGAGRGFTPTMEAPGISAYGGRNAIVLEVLTGLLRVTAKHGVHIILTAHEADPTMVADGSGKEIIDYISIMLGGKLVNSVTWRLSEIWFMMQEVNTQQRDRIVAVRATRKRRPMKSRIFQQSGAADFVLSYDPSLPDDAKGQMTIAGFYHQWLDNEKAKIPVPERPKK